jgi:hypothetical protein
MPYQVDDALPRVMSGTELSLRTNRTPASSAELINQDCSGREQPTLSGNHVESQGDGENWFDVERDYLLARTYSTVGVWESWSSGCRLG